MERGSRAASGGSRPVIGGIGVDVVEFCRVRLMFAAKWERAIARLFTDGERRFSESMPYPARHFAVRIAAKEAAFKALSGSESARAIGWREMEVVLDDLGRPSLVLHGRASDRAAELDVTQAWVSLSHADDVATAFVVLESAR
jgi:holo-[acyl-carrier protein] synthase